MAELSLNPVVKDSDVMMHTWDLAAEKFGEQQIMEHLSEFFPNAAQFFERKIMVRKAEKHVAEGNAVEQQTREEIAQARHYIAMMEKHELGSELAE